MFLSGALAASPRAAKAESELLVKARASLTEVVAVARGLRVQIEGNLRDNLGQPVAGEWLTVGLSSASPQRVQSDALGHFRASLLAEGSGARQVEIRYGGSSLLGVAAAQSEVTVGRGAVELRFDAPDTSPAGQPLDLTVTAVDARGTSIPGLTLDIALDAQVVPALPTNGAGEVRLSARALSRGTHRLVATFRGDEDHVAARAEHRLSAFVTPTVDLDPLPTPVEPGVTLAATGQVHGADGEGVPVVLTAAGDSVSGTTTDTEGRFRLTVESDRLPSGRLELRALAAPTDPTLRSAFSAAQILEIVPPPPPSIAWFVAPVTVGALAAFAAAWRRRPRAAPVPPAPPRLPPPPPFQRRAPPVDDGVLHVEVRSEMTGLPLPATVWLLPEGPPPTLREAPDGDAHGGVRATTDADGRVALSGTGAWLWTEAPGHAPDAHRCHVPPGAHVVVHLQTLRGRIQARHEAVLEAAGRPLLRFGRETPGQAAADLTRRGAPPELVLRFTQAVERGCFGAAPPDISLLAAVEQDAGALTEGFRRPAGVATSIRWSLGCFLCAFAVAPWSAGAQPRAEPVLSESPDWTGISRWIGAGRSARLDVISGPLDLARLTPKASVAVIAPDAPVPAEALLRFVREGGRLLVADENDAADLVWAALGLRMVAAPRGIQPTLAGHPGFMVLTPSAVGIFEGVDRLVTNHPAAFAPTPMEAAVRFADGTPFAFQLRVGNGEIVAIADSSLFINLMQTVPENARLAANALGWLSEEGARPVYVLAGHDQSIGDYAGVAPPDTKLGGPAAFNRAMTKLASARPDAAAVRFFVALLLAATCIYALGLFPGLGGRRRPAGPRFPTLEARSGRARRSPTATNSRNDAP